MTEVLRTGAGDLEVLTAGRGEPRTVFAHGIGAGIGLTRPYASAVAGTRTFFSFRGHGASHVPPPPWSYDDLVDELRAVADHAAATRAVGVSMGAAAITRLVEQTPDRFERLVLITPAALDHERLPHARELVEELVDLPVVPAARVALLDGIIGRRALDDLDSLRAVTAPVLVLAQEGDDLHTVAIAERLASAFPHGELVVLGPGGLLLAHRSRVRQVISAFLS